MRERLLAPALLLPEPSQDPTKALPYIHGRLETRLSTIDLQTISDIPVDFMPRRSVRAAVTDSRQRGNERGDHKSDARATEPGLGTERRRHRRVPRDSGFGRRLRALLAAALISGLARPAWAKPKVEEPHDYGPPPNWTNAREITEAAIRSKLIDPDSPSSIGPGGSSPASGGPC